MKKMKQARKSVLLVAAGALLLMTMMFSAQVISGTGTKYISDMEEFDTGINAVSNADLNALINRMMDERYPKGSIYMTTTGQLPPVGSWALYSMGRVPVGVNRDNHSGVIMDSTITTGGGTVSTIGTIATTGNLVVPNVPANITLTAGRAQWTGGTLSFTGGDVRTAATRSIASNSFTLTNAAMIPTHTHSISYTATHWNLDANVCDSSNRNLADPTNGDATRNPPSWTITIHNTGGAAFTVPLTHTFGNSGIGSITNPTARLNTPQITYTQQAVNAINLTVSGSGTANVTDTVLQPYVTCFIYQRIG